jgi:hypothetical protein
MWCIPHYHIQGLWHLLWMKCHYRDLGEVNSSLDFRLISFVSIKVFWVVMSYSAVIGYQHFGGCCCFHCHICILKEDGSNKVLWSIGILVQHYMASQPRSPQSAVLTVTNNHCSSVTFKLSCLFRLKFEINGNLFKGEERRSFLS